MAIQSGNQEFVQLDEFNAAAPDGLFRLDLSVDLDRKVGLILATCADAHENATAVPVV